MTTAQDRRRFLQSSLAAGAVLGLNQVSRRQAQVSGGEQGGEFRNPRVQPGRVRWHDDFDRACAAARDSGKPVFLLHMMGRLDQRFC
jgi:hypothetical protein